MRNKTSRAAWRLEALSEAIPIHVAQGQQDISFNGIAKELDSVEGLGPASLDKNFSGSATGRHMSRDAIATIAPATPESTRNPREEFPEGNRRKEVESNTGIGSMADGIPGLHDFTKQAFREYPAMAQARLNIHKTETETFETYRAKHLSDRMGLRSYLPLKDEADSLVQSYFASLDDIYNVLDRAGFQEVYQAIWISARTVDGYSLVGVLLVIAIPMCLQSTSIAPTADGVKSYRDRATTKITACQLYIDQHPSRRYTIEELQAQFFLLWAQQLNARRYKQTYVSAGKLVRTFMCAGLHRDTTIVRGRELSDNEKLLRRMIWMAALEFELQAAFEQGMPPASLPTKYERGVHEACEDSNMRDALSLASVCLMEDIGHDHVLKSFLRTQTHGLLDKAIELIQLRITRFTGDQRQLCTALAAHALVRIRYGDASKEDALREAVARHVAAFDGMGFLDRPDVRQGRDSEEPSRAMAGVESWVLDDWFDMDTGDFNAELKR
ncbi:hypothetical protein PRZ48_008905 [Zasmidium cellare]|uniref:Transcription factor domain-containing protein n=1 Tax=Zasmidium cellare TaxID=395010 RepID=A0ABR0EHU2_ZASCE|nr:hypothetical protein PRZ48_008905 [Zasmidium cellare]